MDGKLLHTFYPSWASASNTTSSNVHNWASTLGLTEMTAAHWSALSPVITYWIVSGFYELLDSLDLFSQYRIRPSDEECKRNLASRSSVMKHVILMHGAQTAVALVVAGISPLGSSYEGQFGSITYFHSVLAGLLSTWKIQSVTSGYVDSLLFVGSWLLRISYLAIRQFLALLILDTWVFWGHYLEHTNRWLYRKYSQNQKLTFSPLTFLSSPGNIHSVHHKLYTPFSYGALYNHWAESICVDQIGALMGAAIAGLTDKEACFFYAVVTAKTVEDHCAFDLPWSPFVIFGRWTGAGIVYHNVHHQSWGLKVRLCSEI